MRALDELASDLDRRCRAHASRWRDGVRRIEASRLPCCCTAPVSSPRSGTTSPANSRRTTRSMRSTAAAMATATSPRPTAITSRILPRICAGWSRRSISPNIYGIGHSAGATDLLLAAKLMPARFARLFVMEPTVMDPRAARSDGLSDFGKSARAGRAAPTGRVRKRGRRIRALPCRAGLSEWTENSLRAYIRHGFAQQDDGRVRLLCTPEIESAVLLPILEAMEQVYTGDARGNPFAWLSEIECPVRVATTEKSWSIYKEMASRAVALLAGREPMDLRRRRPRRGPGSADLVLGALKAFEAQAGYRVSARWLASTPAADIARTHGNSCALSIQPIRSATWMCAIDGNGIGIVIGAALHVDDPGQHVRIDVEQAGAAIGAKMPPAVLGRLRRSSARPASP